MEDRARTAWLLRRPDVAPAQVGLVREPDGPVGLGRAGQRHERVDLAGTRVDVLERPA